MGAALLTLAACAGSPVPPKMDVSRQAAPLAATKPSSARADAGSDATPAASAPRLDPPPAPASRGPVSEEVPAGHADEEASEARPAAAAQTGCAMADPEAVRTLTEPAGPKRFFSVDGYRARTLRLERIEPSGRRLHCLTVAWPPGNENNEGQAVRVAARIDAAWLRALENTLARLPWSHVQLVRRIVIDDRPKEHGIAAFDRESSDDARDGHTVWLHEHLFEAPNHWARGNYGTYWSYHVNQDGRTIDGAGTDHDLFSPVLLHEIGHLVMYWIENAQLLGPAAASNIPCAMTCKDTGNCPKLPRSDREQNCMSPYCAPFHFQSSTENWAEQYRLFYQSSVSRSLLARAGSACLPVLKHEQDATPPPWQRGLPDIETYRPSHWDSCGGRACKPW